MSISAVAAPAEQSKDTNGDWPPQSDDTRDVAAWRARFPPRPTVDRWPATGVDRQALDQRASEALCAPVSKSIRLLGLRGLLMLLDWLAEHPGDTWQERWLASGADAAGDDWAELPARWLRERGDYSPSRLEVMTSSFLIAVGLDVVRPSLRWLLTGGKKRKLVRHLTRTRDGEGFARLGDHCDRDETVGTDVGKHVLFRCAVIVAAKVGTVEDITVGDVLEVIDLEKEIRGKAPSAGASIRVLRQVGIITADVPSLKQIHSAGQRTVEQLVDRYNIVCTPIRDLLVDYLRERQPSVDYSTLLSLAYALVRCFWADLERHHQGIESLNLPRNVAGAWKRRLSTKIRTIVRDGKEIQVETERLSHLDILAAVRAFYLDLSQWALEDPSRWAPWVAPCPISQDDLSRRKMVRHRKARMDSRTRSRLPVMPVLTNSTNTWRRQSAALLAAGLRAGPGESFTSDGITMTRIKRPHGSTANVWVADPDTARKALLNRDEDHAFWAWAVIEVLRHTGVRVEELLEISHHSLVQYRLPDSGELVPLLQIAPSKTDTERLLVVSPELAEVLSTIISRHRKPEGTIPLVSARDEHELVWHRPAPLLFQHLVNGENRAITARFVASLLDEALVRTGLTGPDDGQPLRFTPHDFRRIFITDAVMNGLPPHIAQVIAGHQDIGVTMGYKAVYPEETITAHRAFIARRRTLRPSEEYREPTDDEWQQFLGHFQRRKVSVGTCGRAFGSNCIHEHACIRCSLLWPDPNQQNRLLEIRDNLKARVAEAHEQGWLGEVEGLEVSLAGAEDKLTQVQRRTNTPVNLGIPPIGHQAPD